MTLESALTLIDAALHPSCFKNLHQDIFRLSWQGKSYQEIAETCGYDTDYVRHVGYQLWQKLSQALEQKVTKRNLQVVFRRFEQQNQTSSYYTEKTASPPPTPHLAKCNINTYPTKVELVSDQTAYQLLSSDLPSSTYINPIQPFIGHQQEQQTLIEWLTHTEQSIEQTPPVQLVSLLGMAGIGKTSLAQQVIGQIQDQFQQVIWRSLRNAPPFTETFANIINTYGHGTLEWPTHIDAQVEILMHYFRQHRCLLVLDNFETILQPGQMGGHYRPSHQAYGQLLRYLMDSPHQSCVLLTSREQPIGINLRNQPTVQTLYLQGLFPLETHTLLLQQGIKATPQNADILHSYYEGNPYALKVAATNMKSLFNHHVSQWIDQGNFVFGPIQQLLDQQLKRLASPEQQIIDSTTSHTDGVTLDQLHEGLVLPSLVSTTDLLPALQSLRDRSLIHKQEHGFQLPPYLQEYYLQCNQPCSPLKNKVTEPARLARVQPRSYSLQTFSALNLSLNSSNAFSSRFHPVLADVINEWD